MATMKLNIYSKENRGEVEKVYTAESYDLMLGTIEDIVKDFDLDEMTNDVAIASMVLKKYKLLKPFIKDIFVGVTDEELNRVKVKELIPLFAQVFKSIVQDFEIVKTGN